MDKTKLTPEQRATLIRLVKRELDNHKAWERRFLRNVFLGAIGVGVLISGCILIFA